MSSFWLPEGGGWKLETRHSKLRLLALLNLVVRVLAQTGAELAGHLLGVIFLGIDGDAVVEITRLRALQPYPFARHDSHPYIFKKAARETRKGGGDPGQATHFSKIGAVCENRPDQIFC